MSDLLAVKGIGKSSLEKLKLNGIYNCADLVQFFPMKYLHQKIDSLDNFDSIENMTIKGYLVEKPKIYYIRKKLTKMTFTFKVDSLLFQVAIFNREFIAASLKINDELVISGKFQSKNSFIAHDIVKSAHFIVGIIPLYKLEAISSKVFAKWVNYILSNKMITFQETIPPQLIVKNSLLSSELLYSTIHQPLTEQDIYDATKRIKYEELLDFFTRLYLMKQTRLLSKSSQKRYQINLVREFIASLSFELTEDQKEVTNDIFRDLKSTTQMNRLLQGDTGSGKTIVSIIASYAVVTAKEQVAIMAPTEILALQHKLTFEKYLLPYGVRIAYLSSSVHSKERTKILLQLKNQEIDILIGTHALIQRDIEFKKLGFVVIDEQHRFGVIQRKLIREKGWDPDVLFMSATPIPRTLAITLFNDMDVSSIRQMPTGRIPIISDVISYEQIEKSISVLKSELRLGHQAYVVVPIIEENPDSIRISVNEAYDIMRGFLEDIYHIGVLHGKMKNADKEEILNKFNHNDIQVLISTTVVEVGVNVPNATMMIIFNASSFGLSQLHQLRGRVGRSSALSYCHFISDKDIEEEPRLQVLKQTTDGFKISEADLAFRGPGEVFGYQQTGIPSFKMVNFISDQELIQEVMKDSIELLHFNDPISIHKRETLKKTIDTYQID